MNATTQQRHKEWKRIGRLLRRARGFVSIPIIATKVGVERSHYNRIENGERSVPEYRRKEIARILGLRPSQLVPKFSPKKYCPYCGHKL